MGSEGYNQFIDASHKGAREEVYKPRTSLIGVEFYCMLQCMKKIVAT